MSGHEVMQRFGYHYLYDQRSGKDSYSKRLYREHYPRFHVYLNDADGKITFSMHLDQKQASYQGTARHSGEYEGPLVEAEIGNLKRFIVGLVQQSRPKPIQEVKEKKPWWRLF